MSERQSIEQSPLNAKAAHKTANHQTEHISNPETLNQLAFLNPETVSPAGVLQMQHMIGNQAVRQLIQSFISKGPGQEQTVMPTRPNRTGLPDRLKQGVEQISGISLDNVRVRYNSDRPAQVEAHAYTQGTNIHVAPGQERHLPHEAWHVVQQTQGRVQATMQMQGVNVNDDAGLEREADVMGKIVTEGCSQNIIGDQMQQACTLNQAAVPELPRQRIFSSSSTVQYKKYIRDGKIVEIPDEQQTPFKPFSGRGMRVGSNSRIVGGSMMVTRSVADSVAMNAANNLPHFRPELGEVGHVSWVLTGRDSQSGQAPHTGIQHADSGAEPKDVELPVQISIPQDGPEPVNFSNQDLLDRLQQSRTQLVSDDSIRREAMTRIQQASGREVEKRFKDGVPVNLRRQLETLKRDHSEAEAIKMMKMSMHEQICKQKAEKGFKPESIPPAVVEKNMWNQLGNETRATELGISHVNLERGPLSRQAGGQFTLIAPHARHRLRLIPQAEEGARLHAAALLQQREDKARTEAEKMNQQAALRQEESNQLLRQLAKERIARQHGVSTSTGEQTPHQHEEAPAAAEAARERLASEKQIEHNLLLHEMEMERRSRKKQ